MALRIPGLLRAATSHAIPLARSRPSPHTSAMSPPAWFLLVWCGIAATCAAAVTGVVIGGGRGSTWALVVPRPERRRFLVRTAAAGALLYPLVYGTLFEAAHRADLRAGLLLGTAHALLVFAAGRRAPVRMRVRAAAMHLVYGITIAILYVTP